MSNPETGNDMVFRIHKAANGAAARLGQLTLPRKKPFETPNFVGIASRGAIPHLTVDVLQKHTEMHGAYMALEDFIEKSIKRAGPAIYSAPENGHSRLHSYTALPSEVVTIMGARRYPAVVAPMGNGAKHLSIFTSTGFQSLELERFCNAILTLKPDLVIPMADLTFDTGTRSVKRLRRMLERTDEWVEGFFKALDPNDKLKPLGIHVFAPTLPAEYSLQWEYLNRLSEDHAHKLSGLAIYDADILVDLEAHAPLASLPRLSMDSPASPHQILRQVQLGVDVFAIPFLNSASDGGTALAFSFPPPPREAGGVIPLGINLWSKEYQVSVKPLMDGCSCYTCTRHHRAYICHLLDAREMLSWTLLQIHNHHVISEFFKGIRSAIADGTLDQKVTDFALAYDNELPYSTGERPRARGYHFKSEAAQPKYNDSPWKSFDGNPSDDQALAGEVAGLAVTGAAEVKADVPLAPEDAAAGLDEKGFAQVDEKL
ncbi:putative tRNA-guanine transglycosylase family protein [Seiridium cardinale]